MYIVLAVPKHGASPSPVIFFAGDDVKKAFDIARDECKKDRGVNFGRVVVYYILPNKKMEMRSFDAYASLGLTIFYVGRFFEGKVYESFFNSIERANSKRVVKRIANSTSILGPR